MASPKKSLLFFLSTILFISFVLFSYLVAKEVFSRIDFDTTVKVQDHIPGKFDLPFSILTLFGSIEVTSIIWVGLLILSFVKKHYRLSLALFIFWLGMSLEIFGKVFLLHPAPPFYFFRGEGIIFPSSFVHTNYSYPSGHIYRLTFLVTFLVAGLYLRQVKKHTLATIFTCGVFLALVFISRIYLGEHWLTDVVGGMFLGASLGIIPALIIKKGTSQDME